MPSNSKIGGFIASMLNPKVYLHGLRVLHFYAYSHVCERVKVKVGAGSAMAPNVSLRNGERISIGKGCHLGERALVWAGDTKGEITLGDFVSLAPGVFITASDYAFSKGVAFREQPKNESNVTIGNDVWLGANVVVTAGVAIGDGCIVGAGAVVTKDLPPNSIAGGVPAKVIGQRIDHE